MTDLGGIVQDESGAKYPETDAPAEEEPATAGTDRDYDESGETEDQGHGHARDRQDDAAESGHAEKQVTETDREQRDLGGPGG